MRNSRSFKIAAGFALATLPCLVAPAGAQNPQAPTLPDALARIGQYAQQALGEQGAPGMALAITDRTHTLKIYTIGYANVAAQTPVTESTRFGIGSLTKSMTATALMELRDERRFDPYKPVTAYLPWFSVHTSYRPITAHDLFTHTSGLPDGSLSTGVSSVYAMRDWYTGYAPGTHWSYSNVGYDTLGLILESLDGADYATVMQRRVFAPLDMTDTTATWSPQLLSKAATGYLYRADDIPTPPHPELVVAPTTHYVDPAGSVLSTPGDMAKYMRYILNGGETPKGRIISSESWKLMTSPSVTDGHELGDSTPGFYHRYAYGLAVETLDGDTLVGHTGGVLQYTACMQLDVTRGFGAVALTNLAYVGPRPCPVVAYALKVLRAQAEDKALPDVPAPADPLKVDKAADYAGSYRAPDGTMLVVQADADRLTLQHNGQSLAMYPRGANAFWVGGPDFSQYLVQFGRQNGKVVEAFYGPQWYTSDAYSGPKTFAYPSRWNAYVGHYESIDTNGYFGSLRLFIRKGKLVTDDGTQLVPLANGMFRVGDSAWTPERMAFDEIIDGHAQRVRIPGGEYYRTEAP
ncbi:MAG: serine hydrolase domain-containing protein [Vulcanimicrobiaceae bacterium]